MSKLDRHVLDTYDDLDGQVLRELVAQPAELPEFIKTAQRLTNDQIEAAPDLQFALVMFDGSHKFKKYAMQDKGNTALSVAYLLKQAHLLPPLAVKTAAHNLLRACDRFDLEAPMQLKVAAKSGVSGISGKSQTPYAKNAKVSKLQFPTPEPGGQFTENPELGNYEDRDPEQRTNYQGVQGNNLLELPIFSAKEKRLNEGGYTEKLAVAGNPSHWNNEYIQRAQKESQAGLGGFLQSEAQTRFQRWGDGEGVTPYVNITGWDPALATAPETVQPERTLMDGQYPVDSYDQVKTAAEYFAERRYEFQPRQRHEYCVKLASRMQELGLPISEDIERYGSTSYAADTDSYVEYRRSLLGEHMHPALDVLLEKRASVSPEVFVQAVEEFDKMSGLNYFWDGRVPDPWYTTFGPSLEKRAAAEWCWDHQGTRIREEDLRDLARNGVQLLEKSFRRDLVEAFLKNPKTIFVSLPYPEQLVMARLAADPRSGTGTE